MEKPRLRPVEVFPITHEGKQMFHIHDPLGLAEEVVVSPAAFQILAQFFNGEHSFLDMQTALMRSTGSLVPSDDLKRLSDALDEAGLLDSTKFQTRVEGRRREYAASPVRPAHHAGGAYPDDRDHLVSYLDEMLRAARNEGACRSDGMRALIAPHIDFARGAVAYGFAYSALGDGRPVRTVVVLGTGHHVREQPFIVTEKDFATPLGTVRTNRAIVERLARKCGDGLLANQCEHQTEHSVEFQVVFLRHLLGDSFDIVPVLCGAFPPPEAGKAAPSEDSHIRAFIEELRAAIAEGDGCLVVGGVDFAHVGPRFGAEEPVDQRLLDDVEASDRALLDHICNGDADGFYRRLALDGNRHAVCGYAAIYTLLALVPGIRGKLLYYDQAVRVDGSEAVSFAAVALA